MADRLPKLAVLIDGDNVSPDLMEKLFEKVADLGPAVIRDVYGSQAGGQRWLAAAARFALSRGRRHPQATGRNATDIEMVIGAMDIMARGDVDGLCLVSSDSDFTSLAIRLREAGKLVIGFGGAAAPESLRRACDRFHVLQAVVKVPPKAAALPSSKGRLPPEHAIVLLKEAFEACSKDGWAGLSLVGKHIRSNHPGFSPADYGAAGIKTLIGACGVFDLKQTSGHDVFRPAKAGPALKLVPT